MLRLRELDKTAKNMADDRGGEGPSLTQRRGRAWCLNLNVPIKATVHNISALRLMG